MNNHEEAGLAIMARLCNNREGGLRVCRVLLGKSETGRTRMTKKALALEGALQNKARYFWKANVEMSINSPEQTCLRKKEKRSKRRARKEKNS